MRSLILFPLLLISAAAQPIILPRVTVPPPNTNLYFLKWVCPWTNYNPQWAFDIYYGSNSSASNFIADGPKFCGSTGCIVLTSNLVFGKTNWFKSRLKYPGYGVTNWFYERYWDGSNGALRDFTDVTQFPPVQPLLTNFVWLGATNWTGKIFTNPIPQMQFYKVTNGLLYGFNSLSGQWLRLDTVTTPSGTKNLYLQMDTSNNQIPYGKFMHKQ